MRKPKMVAGLCLLSQALLFLLLCFSNWSRSRSLSGKLALLSAASGAGGAWLFLSGRKTKSLSDAIDEDFDGDDDDLGDELEDPFDGEVTCSFGVDK